MDTYPAFEQAEGTEATFRSGIMIRTATNGATRARALTSVLHADPSLVHLALTDAELATLYAFHEAHRGIAFDVDYWPESRTVTCLFADPPFEVKAFKVAGGLRFRVDVKLVQQ
jgi:hypothetical protein